MRIRSRTFRRYSRRFYAGTPSPRSVCTRRRHISHNTGRNHLAGVSHRVTKSDVYEGFFIPAGSTVIPNVWYAPSCTSSVRCCFQQMGFPGECCATPTSSPSPIGLTPKGGLLRAFPHFPARRLALERGFVPECYLRAEASGRIWLGYWPRSTSHLRRTVFQRGYTPRGSYRASTTKGLDLPHPRWLTERRWQVCETVPVLYTTTFRSGSFVGARHRDRIVEFVAL
jgi:hypothetical protein